jgi:hypothetical protein
MSEWILSAISEAFRAHGIESKIESSCVEVGSALRVHPSTEVHKREPDIVTIQLDIRTEATLLGRSNPFVDSFAGIGATETDAEKNALEKFLLGSFHVVAEALTTHECGSEQVEWEDWKTRTTSWKVCSGPLLTQATVESRTKSQYGEVLSKIQDQFLRQSEPGPHWIRIYVGFLDGKMSASEAILDGEEWSEVQMILRQTAWAPSPDYESLRHILVALPLSECGANERLQPTSPPPQTWLKWLVHALRRGRS